MSLVLDSGALIALEKNDRVMWRRLKAALLANSVPVSHGGIVGQVWRGGAPRQALLARALASIDIRPLDESLGRAAGDLLARAGSADVIDAALVLLADDGDDIVTSDPEDIEPLAAHLGRHVELLHV
ncbi:MAG TPA: twitching motility protein PilT [Gammaproteobacteria bacterium]|nr:twitching motility protein PilT [Gammaproteobacteria bacterium]